MDDCRLDICAGGCGWFVFILYCQAHVHGNRESFHHAGGEHFAAIPCLNDSEAGMAMLETLVRDEPKGWA